MKTKSVGCGKAAKKSQEPLATPSPNGPSAAPGSEVLTLSEAAAFLRVSEEEICKRAEAGQFPGKKFGSEWRILKTALCAWLSGPETASVPVDWRESNRRLLEMAGIWKDDETIPELLDEIYKERKRHLVQEIQD